MGYTLRTGVWGAAIISPAPDLVLMRPQVAVGFKQFLNVLNLRHVGTEGERQKISDQRTKRRRCLSTRNCDAPSAANQLKSFDADMSFPNSCFAAFLAGLIRACKQRAPQPAIACFRRQILRTRTDSLGCMYAYIVSIRPIGTDCLSPITGEPASKRYVENIMI